MKAYCPRCGATFLLDWAIRSKGARDTVQAVIDAARCTGCGTKVVVGTPPVSGGDRK